MDPIVCLDNSKDSLGSWITHSETLWIVGVHNVGDKVSGEGNTTVESDLHLNILDTSRPSMVTVELFNNMLDHLLVWHCTHGDMGAVKPKGFAALFDGRRTGVNSGFQRTVTIRE